MIATIVVAAAWFIGLIGVWAVIFTRPVVDRRRRDRRLAEITAKADTERAEIRTLLALTPEDRAWLVGQGWDDPSPPLPPTPTGVGPPRAARVRGGVGR